MERFISYEKLSKKEKRIRDALKRGTWGPLSPCARRPANSRAYDRNKVRREVGYGR